MGEWRNVEEKGRGGVAGKRESGGVGECRGGKGKVEQTSGRVEEWGCLAEERGCRQMV